MRQPKKLSISWTIITDSRLFFPLVALFLILLFDFIFIPGFFNIENRDGNLYGSLIDILRNGSTVSLLAIGMTLVIATGGVDLSVGAVMAIAASVAGILMNPSALRNEVFFVTDPYLHLSTAMGGNCGALACGHNLWFVERDVGCLHENSTHGGHTDLDDCRARDCPVDHKRSQGPDHL